MIKGEIINILSIELLNISREKILRKICHEEIISPFSRIYLIKEGKGTLYIGDEKIELRPGFLYLIPSYTVCTYSFSEDIDQYYIHFKTASDNGVNIFDFCTNKFCVKTEKYHEILFKKLLQMHPNCKLPSEKPNIYQSKKWLNRKTMYNGITEIIETKAIIELLLARFLYSKSEKTKLHTHSKYRIKPILLHIENNLDSRLEVTELSAMLFITPDHFTKIFKRYTAYTPIEYINKKRIERAQSLLLTTENSITEIVEKVGFRSIGYFSKKFKSITGYTPSQYRNLY